ncbi:MAG: urease accessory protein UreE [Pleurocapsa sp.]
MIEVAQTYIGNTQDSLDLAELTTTETCLEVTLRESDRHKGRIHAHTDSGIAVGIIKSRDRILRSGDIFKTDSDKLLLIHVQEQELLVLDLLTIDASVADAKLVYLGHLLGNHHYPITMQDNKIYVQLITDKSIIEKLIHELNIPGLQIKYQRQSDNQEFAFLHHSH